MANHWRIEFASLTGRDLTYNGAKSTGLGSVKRGAPFSIDAGRVWWRMDHTREPDCEPVPTLKSKPHTYIQNDWMGVKS